MHGLPATTLVIDLRLPHMLRRNAKTRFGSSDTWMPHCFVFWSCEASGRFSVKRYGDVKNIARAERKPLTTNFADKL